MSGAGKSAEEMAAEDAAAAIRAEAEEEAAQEALEAEAAEAGADGSAWETPPEGEPDFAAVIGALQDELETARDQRIRAAAEMENLRRRTAREVADAKKFAVSSFARDLLSVSDNLTRALTVVTDDEKAAASEVWKNLLEGVQMTERELLSVLDKNGVKKINPEGERFDPNQHQAVAQIPDPSKPSGTVLHVMAPGFLIGERVLRPAMVGVSSGGPKPDAKPEAVETEEPAAETTLDAEPGETVDKSA